MGTVPPCRNVVCLTFIYVGLKFIIHITFYAIMMGENSPDSEVNVINIKYYSSVLYIFTGNQQILQQCRRPVF